MSFARTIDWDAHWAEADRADQEELRAAGRRMADRLGRFFDDVPDSLVDVGCGPAFTLFELAERHPGADLVGIDAAASVIRRNRELAGGRDLANLAFRVGSLPDLPELRSDRRFDCVTCIATLHYVPDVETALRSLFDLVRAGGTLVFNYPNRHTRAAYRDDPDASRERFELVLAGENLLTYDDIEDVLSRRPRSFWKAVGADDWRAVGRVNPCVVVQK